MTFPSTAPDRVIDWILVPPAWRIREQQVLDVQLSDHRPVVAAFEMGSAEPR